VVNGSAKRGQAASLAEGLRSAEARRAALARLIETNPDRALALAVPDSVRRRLPAAVRAQLETPVSGTGDYLVMAVDPPPGGPPVAESFQRWVRLNGRRHRA
jgi:hypothetical protein